MRTVGIALVAVLVIGVLAWPADAQDSTRERMVDLETRVSALETQVSGTSSQGGADDEELHTITGELRLDGPIGRYSRGNPCTGEGGYSDLRAGARVVVLNERDEPIAVGSLGRGEGAPYGVCVFPIHVPDVPTARFYSIEISGRDGPTYSYDEMVEQDWEIRLSIG